MHPKAIAFTIAAVLALTAGIWFTRPSQIEAAPQDLSITQTCTPDGRLSARFNWNDANPAIVQQWLDLSLADNHWQPGTYLGNGPMPASQQSLTWIGLQQGSRHFIRINQWLPGAPGAGPEWQSSDTFYFDTGNCTPGAKGVAGVILPSGGSGANLPPVEADRKRVQAPIEDAQVLPGAQPGTFVAQVKAGLPGGCARQGGYTVDRQSGPTVTVITVLVYNTLPAIQNMACTQIYGLYNITADLGPLTAGPTYEIHVNDKTIPFAIP
jgi:hypothetical protein